MLASFEQHILSKNFVRPGEKIFIACSGGPDSVALFHLFRLLPAKIWKLRLGLIHLNHGMRGKTSLRDQKFVRELAYQFNVPFFTGKVSVKDYAKKNRLSPEEAARTLRYRFFDQAAAKLEIRKIALAHTLNDQAETILMRVIQGTGSKGLLGIRETIRQGRLTLFRPLLYCRKEELLGFLKMNRFKFCKDETNKKTLYLRNRIRLELLPFVEKGYNPRVQEALARIPSILQEEEACLEEVSEYFSRKLKVRSSKGGITLDLKAFREIPSPLQFRVLNRLLARIDPRSGLNYDNWRKLRGALQKKSYRHSLKKDIDITISSSRISIYKRKTR